MSREIFYSENPEENENRVSEEDSAALARKLTIRPEGQFSPEMRKILDRVDFQKLKSIFEGLAKGCGIPEAKLNFLGKERVLGHDYTHNQLGSYNLTDNTISLTEYEDIWDYGDKPTEQVKSEYLEKARLEYGSIDFKVLATLVHEETHAISKNVCREFNKNEFYQDGTKRERPETWFDYSKSGYALKGKNMIFALFTSLNEGIVDKLSREVLLKYAEETNWPEQDVDAYMRTLENKPEILTYNNEVQLVDVIIKRLAEKLEQDESVVWEGFVRGLLEGEEFKEETVKKMFESAFGKDFINELGDLHPGFMDSEEKLNTFRKKYGV